jgi:predicted transcriptional regulator
MREAIAEYVTREEKREQLRQEMMAAWEEFDRTGLHVTAKEADVWLSALGSGKRRPLPKCHV